jgi:hypothetical protein
MALWPTTLQIGREDLRLLATCPQGNDLLKARLPIRPRHHRALLTLLEGMALWSGEPLYVVISAGKYRESWLSPESQWGELWPEESQLVQFDLADPPMQRRRRLDGMGDFTDVRRQLAHPWGRR